MAQSNLCSKSFTRSWTYWDMTNKLPFEIMNNKLSLFAFSCASVSLALQHDGFVPRELLARGVHVPFSGFWLSLVEVYERVGNLAIWCKRKQNG